MLRVGLKFLLIGLIDTRWVGILATTWIIRKRSEVDLLLFSQLLYGHFTHLLDKYHQMRYARNMYVKLGSLQQMISSVQELI